MLKIEGKSIKEFFVETPANTAWCIRMQYAFQSDRIGLSRTYATHRIKSNKLLLDYIIRRLESRDNRLISARVYVYIYAYVINPDVAQRGSPESATRWFDAASREISFLARERKELVLHSGRNYHSSARNSWQSLEEDPRSEFGWHCISRDLLSARRLQNRIWRRRMGRASFWRNKISKWVSR